MLASYFRAFFFFATVEVMKSVTTYGSLVFMEKKASVYVVKIFMEINYVYVATFGLPPSHSPNFTTLTGGSKLLLEKGATT